MALSEPLQRPELDGEQSPVATPSSSSTPAVDAGSRLACPFVKRYGVEGTRGPACTGEGFKSTHRLKEHLYRCHKPPFACPRCHLTFKDQADVFTHLMKESICETKPAPENDCVTVLSDAQMKRLKKRARSNVPEEEQWQQVYKIVFPSETTIPSPYVDRIEASFKREFRVKLAAELRSILVDKIFNSAEDAKVRHLVKTSLENIINSGLLNAAIERASESVKRQRTSSEDEHSITSRPDEPANLKGEREELDDCETNWMMPNPEEGFADAASWSLGPSPMDQHDLAASGLAAEIENGWFVYFDTSSSTSSAPNQDQPPNP